MGFLNNVRNTAELALQGIPKGSFQKLFSGFCPLRGGGYPPFPLSFFEHIDCPLRGGGVPPNSVKEKIR